MEEEKKELQGALHASVSRNIKSIREDRGAALIEDAQLAYKRRVEDQDMAITRLKRAMANSIDLSPNNTTSLVNPSNFDGQVFADTDSERAFDLWRSVQALEQTKQRYTQLFGVELETAN